MRIIFDKAAFEGAIYNERNLVQCKCGRHWYPSKRMFVRFLRNYKDIPGAAEIWSHTNLDTGKVTIHVELSYFISDAKEEEKRR